MDELALTLTNSQLQKLDQEYEKLVDSSHFDSGWETDYEAALRAPAAFMLSKITNFESTFDRIIFHLDDALKKTEDIYISKAISRTADDQFSRLIHVIQNQIEYIKKQNERGFFEKFADRIGSIVSTISTPSSYFTAGTPGASIAVNIAPEVGNMFKDFLLYFNQKLQIEKDETIFYNQLSHVYQKILDSNCYNPEFGLIRNTFTRNKEDIIKHVVYQKGLTAGRHLMKFDKTDAEKQDSFRIICYALAEIQDWDNLIEFLTDMKPNNYANYKELEKAVIKEFAEVHRNKLLGAKQLFSSKLNPIKTKLLDEYVKEFQIKIMGNYNEYLSQKKKALFYKLMLLGVGFILSLIITIYLFVSKTTYHSSPQGGQDISLYLFGIIVCFGIIGISFLYVFDTPEKKKIRAKLKG